MSRNTGFGASNSAVKLMHRCGEGRRPHTNVAPSSAYASLAEAVRNHYVVGGDVTEKSRPVMGRGVRKCKYDEEIRTRAVDAPPACCACDRFDGGEPGAEPVGFVR